MKTVRMIESDNVQTNKVFYKAIDMFLPEIKLQFSYQSTASELYSYSYSFFSSWFAFTISFLVVILSAH